MATTIDENHSPTGGTVDTLGAKILDAFPELESDARRVAVCLYRLLERGEPVGREDLARAASVDVARTGEILASWPGVYYEGARVIGFWGLTPRPFSKHLVRTNGRTSYAWCAWDTLFLPGILGMTAEVESEDPETGVTVRLSVSPERVERVEPARTVMSMVEPTDDLGDDVVARFCHFIYFFPSPEVGARWVTTHPGTFLLSVEDGFALGRHRNHGQFGEALDLAPPA